jgi:hypothetical protein
MAVGRFQSVSEVGSSRSPAYVETYFGKGKQHEKEAKEEIQDNSA